LIRERTKDGLAALPQPGFRSPQWSRGENAAVTCPNRGSLILQN
jgi:hypothetical protein